MARFITRYDLEFDRCPIEAISSGGTRFTRWVPFGMPRIPDAFADAAFFLYRNEEDALAERNAGGTGFLIARPSEADPETPIVIAVSNWHVVRGETGASVIRLTKKDGTPDPLAFDPGEWFYDPKGPDAVVLPVDLDVDTHRCGFIPIHGDMEANASLGFSPVGLGDDVFMVGCFVDPEDRREVDRPTVRFGNISMMPAAIKQANGNKLPAYCLDMHSRTGYSGSPVFVFRTPFSDLTRTNGAPRNLNEGHLLLWLGIHIGQFREDWKIVTQKKKKERHEANEIEATEQVVRGVSGMTAVVPSADVLKLLEMPDVRKAIQRQEEKIATRPRRSRLEPEAAESVPPTTEKGDEKHRERFTALLDEALGKPKQGD